MFEPDATADSIPVLLPAELGDQPADRDTKRRQLGWFFWASVGWLGVLTLAALLAPILPLPNPNAIGTGQPFAGPSLHHLLGTDDLGRDLLSRLIFGARVSLAIGLGASTLSLVVGGSLGLAAGFLRGATDVALGTLANVLLAFPALIFALAVVTFLGPHLVVIIVAVGILGVAPMFRVVRGTTVSVADREFVLSARIVGTGRFRILRREIVPNVAPTVMAYFLVSVATAILIESGLAFLGLSVAPPTPTWGGMVNEGLQFLSRDPWISLWPSIILLLTLLALNFAGDRLLSTLDARRGQR